MGVLKALLDLLLPPKCPFCGALLARGEDGLCAKCQSELPWLQGPAAERNGGFFAVCVSPLRYTGRVRQAVHRYKFKGVSAHAPLYGRLVARCVSDHLPGRYDLISWVPLSDRRRRERGYDQALLLARAVAETLGGAVVPTLRKSRNTQAQSGLEGAERRRANVLGAYACVDRKLVAGKRVLLIDDVITTGSTLDECARVLLTAGAAEVVCAALARAR